MKLFFFVLILLASTPAESANFPGAFPTRNEKLREQLESDPDRIFPRTEYFSGAVDADVFAPGYTAPFRGADPYHGKAYWIESRLEFVPTEAARLNLKLIPWYGTTSKGYGAGAEFHALGGVSWDDSLFGTDWRFRFRAIDLGTQTFGGGLVVQDRAMSGLRVEFEHRKLLMGTTVDGTGTLAIDGELYHHFIGTADGRFTLGMLAKNTNSVPEEAVPATFYLLAKRPVGANTLAQAEFAANRNAPAARLASETKIETGTFTFSAKPELRYYGRGFAGGIRGRTQQVYTGYDLQSVSYTNAVNIFRTSDAAFVPAARVIAEWHAFRRTSFYLDQEAGRFDFRDAVDEDYYFWEAGVRFFPTLPRRDYATIGVTNKLLTAFDTYTDATTGQRSYSSVRPTDMDNQYRKPRFIRQFQVVVTLHSSF